MAFVAPGGAPFFGADGGVFLGFHGAKNGAGATNLRNATLYYDIERDEYVQITHADQAGIGHLNTLVVVDGWLLMLDMSSQGSMSAAGANSGGLYRFALTEVPEPGTWAPVAAGLLAAVLRIRRVRRSSLVQEPVAEFAKFRNRRRNRLRHL